MICLFEAMNKYTLGLQQEVNELVYALYILSDEGINVVARDMT